MTWDGLKHRTWDGNPILLECGERGPHMFFGKPYGTRYTGKLRPIFSCWPCCCIWRSLLPSPNGCRCTANAQPRTPKTPGREGPGTQGRPEHAHAKPRTPGPEGPATQGQQEHERARGANTKAPRTPKPTAAREQAQPEQKICFVPAFCVCVLLGKN